MQRNVERFFIFSSIFAAVEIVEKVQWIGFAVHRALQLRLELGKVILLFIRLSISFPCDSKHGIAGWRLVLSHMYVSISRTTEGDLLRAGGTEVLAAQYAVFRLSASSRLPHLPL